MWLCTLYLILPLCLLATISRTKEALLQKADAGTPLSRGEHVCRCFPMIARNLSNSRNKFVLCRPAFHGYWLFYCFRAGAWLKYRISSLETRKNAASRLEQEGWNSGKIGWGVTITPFLPHSLEEGALKANGPVYNSPVECDILLIIYLSNWGQVQVCMIGIILVFIFMSVGRNWSL